jgi:hypothetical protein
MSGTVCEIIIRGNRLQAFAETFLDAAGGIMPNARLAAHLALTLCQLGTTSYDGAEVMTDDQQKLATQIMDDFNIAAITVDASRRFDGKEHARADMMLAIFIKKAQLRSRLTC